MNDLSKGVAALASNPTYQQNYASLDSDKDEDDSYNGASHHDCCPLSGDEGAEDDDDDDFIDLDPALDNEGHSLFPKNKAPQNFLISS